MPLFLRETEGERDVCSTFCVVGRGVHVSALLVPAAAPWPLCLRVLPGLLLSHQTASRRNWSIAAGDRQKLHSSEKPEFQEGKAHFQL